MSADASWRYHYDNNGNLTEKDSTGLGSNESWTYAYNSTNELTEVNQYNAFGSILHFPRKS